MNTKRFAAKLRAFPNVLQRNLAEAERRTQQDALKVAIRLSSGTETPKTLTLAGHPYSRRAPNASFDPSRINSQSGLFRSSWVAPTQFIVGRTIHTSVLNTDPKAAFMQGTSKMVPRPIAAEVLKIVDARRKARIESAISKTLKGYF